MVEKSSDSFYYNDEQRERKYCVEKKRKIEQFIIKMWEK